MIISAYTHLKQYFLLQSHGVRVFDTNIIVTTFAKQGAVVFV